MNENSRPFRWAGPGTGAEAAGQLAGGAGGRAEPCPGDDPRLSAARFTTGRAAWSGSTASPRPRRSAAFRTSCCAPSSRTSLSDVEHELLERAEWTGELRHRRRDGSEIVVVSHQSLRRDAAGATPLVTEVNNDITEARRGRDALQYLASIVESSEDAIIGKTLDGVVTAWNAQPRRCSATAPRR